MKDEITSKRVFTAPLEAIAVANGTKIVMAGEGKVKVYSATDFKEVTQETFDLPQGVGKVSKM